MLRFSNIATSAGVEESDYQFGIYYRKTKREYFHPSESQYLPGPGTMYLPHVGPVHKS